MTLNGHFALNTVFRAESFSMDAILRHDCFKLHGDAYYTVSGKDVATVCGFWRYKPYADICRSSLVEGKTSVSEQHLYSLNKQHTC